MSNFLHIFDIQQILHDGELLNKKKHQKIRKHQKRPKYFYHDIVQIPNYD
jgi:hypothetical protein